MIVKSFFKSSTMEFFQDENIYNRFLSRLEESWVVVINLDTSTTKYRSLIVVLVDKYRQLPGRVFRYRTQDVIFIRKRITKKLIKVFDPRHLDLFTSVYIPPDLPLDDNFVDLKTRLSGEFPGHALKGGYII